MHPHRCSSHLVRPGLMCLVSTSLCLFPELNGSWHIYAASGKSMNRTATAALVVYSLSATVLLLVAANVFSLRSAATPAKATTVPVRVAESDPTPVPAPVISIDRQAAHVPAMKIVERADARAKMHSGQIVVHSSESPKRERVARTAIEDADRDRGSAHQAIRSDRLAAAIDRRDTTISRQMREVNFPPMAPSKRVVSNHLVANAFARHRLPPAVTYKPHLQFLHAVEYRPMVSASAPHPAPEQTYQSDVIETYTPNGGVTYRPAAIEGDQAVNSVRDDQPRRQTYHRHRC